MPHTSASTSSAGLGLAWVLLFGGIFATVGFIGAAIGVLIIALNAERMSLLVVFPFFLVILALFAIYPLTFGYFRLYAERRMAAVAALHPDAYVLHVVMRPKLARQWKAAAAALGMSATRVPWNNYAVLVADSSYFTICGGTGTPRVSLPTAALAQVSYQPVTIGVRTLTEFILQFRDANGLLWPIEVLPVRWPGVVVRTVPAEHFPVEFAAMQAATHPA